MNLETSLWFRNLFSVGYFFRHLFVDLRFVALLCSILLLRHCFWYLSVHFLQIDTGLPFRMRKSESCFSISHRLQILIFRLPRLAFGPTPLFCSLPGLFGGFRGTVAGLLGEKLSGAAFNPA